MLDSEKYEFEPNEQATEIKNLINEIQYTQTDLIIIVQKNHATNMKKIDKIIEFNKICDMTNQIFEKRISNIEKMLDEIKNNKSA